MPVLLGPVAGETSTVSRDVVAICADAGLAAPWPEICVGGRVVRMPGDWAAALNAEGVPGFQRPTPTLPPATGAALLSKRNVKLLPQRIALALLFWHCDWVVQVSTPLARLLVQGVLLKFTPPLPSPERYTGELKAILVTVAPSGTGTEKEPPLRSLFMLYTTNS